MARRSRSVTPRRPSLRLESLEQRQLLATILAGSGSEVGSNIVHSNGNTYDQILLTGPSVTVSADPGQVVRISYLDLGGDIVQTEFSGQGTVTISLEEYRTQGMPGFVYKNPVQYIQGQPVHYVQGLATVTVEKPSISTNVGFYAAGHLQNPAFFSKTDGDNGIADIARLILVGDTSSDGGYSMLGGIYAGGVNFSASTGVVGIRAENVAVQNIVSIGEIDAKGSGVPTLLFSSNSQIQTVFVRGGDLRQTNGASFDSYGFAGDMGSLRTIGGFTRLTSTDGTTSQGKLLWSSPINESALRLALVEQETLMSGHWVYDWRDLQSVKVTLNGDDVSSVYGGDWLAKGGFQTSLDLAFQRRSFLGNITVIGDLPAGYELNLADARGNVTLEGNLHGKLTVDGVGAGIDGTLLIKGDVDGSIFVNGLDRAQLPPSVGVVARDGLQNAINALVVEGSLLQAADIRAEEIGSVTIRKNFSGIISTDVSRGNDWTATASGAGANYRDVEGKIGAVSIGYDVAGVSTGGSIIHGTVQGMSGIGNVKVGGDIYGTPQNQAVFVTTSNPGAAATEVARYGVSNIGTIDVRGDIDLDAENLRLIYINGNGSYGNVTVAGLVTSGTVSGAQTGTKTELIPYSATFVRILSPFTEDGFTTNPSKGQILVNGYDPDGVAGPLDGSYVVTAADVTAGAQVFDLVAGKLVAAKVGDRVPVISEGRPVLDVSGAVVYRQTTALFEGKTREVPVFGPDVTTLVSGNRGGLNGNFNHFGRIEIAGVTGGPQSATGSISITDNADLTFGGVSVRPTDAGGGAPVLGSSIGAISIRNTAGATSDLRVVGVIGAVDATDNASVAYRNVTLEGLTINGFEDVRFVQGSSGTKGIQVGEITQGVTINTVTGLGSGTGVGTVSPSVIFDSVFLMGKGSGDTASSASVTINTGLVNSTIGFSQTSGINGYVGTPSTALHLGAISLTADTLYYDGSLTGASIGAITLNGGTGLSSGKDAAVRFGGSILASSIASITASSTEGNVVFAPTTIAGLGTKVGNSGITPVVTISGGINLSTALTSGGDITLGSGAVYDANLGNITISAGHIFRLNAGGSVVDNPGNVTLNLATSSNVGDISVTTTTGDITDLLKIQGNAGNITYTAGAAIATSLQNYQGVLGQLPDVVRFGDIKVNQTIWGNRGATTLETFGQNSDGSGKALPDYTIGGVTYRTLANGTVGATLTYAGASTAASDALVVKTGGGQAVVTLVIGSRDDNGDQTLSPSELGHGGNVAISSVSGPIRFTGQTDLPDATQSATLGNVSLKTSSFSPSSGAVTPDLVGDIFLTLGSVSSKAGFEGKLGNVSATTTGGDISIEGVIDGLAGHLTLTTGAVKHAGATIVGDINFARGLTFNQGHGLIKATATDIGTIRGNLTSNGAQGGGVELATQYGVIFATIAAGSFDANNDGQISANEYGRTGNVAITTAGGVVNLNLNSNRYVSQLEQSAIGNVTIATSAFVEAQAGAVDKVGFGLSALGSQVGTGFRANGDVTVTGAITQTGAIGDLAISAQVGKIQHLGTFGDIGTSTFTTGSLVDLDSVANVTGEAPLVLESGYIDLFVEVNGLHGLSRYTTTGDGVISGRGSYGGAAIGAESLITSSAQGNTVLTIVLHDADRNKNGIISSDEYGSFGSSRLETTGGGDVFYTMEILGRNADVLAKPFIPEFSFGNVTASVVDRYDSVSASSADGLADAGKITIIGKADVGTVGSITANTVRGDLSFIGSFGNLGDQTLSITRHLDAVGTDTNALLGNLSYVTSVKGVSGTAVLRTDDSGATGNGLTSGGSITGSAFYGGSIAAGKTISIDAKTGKANIDIEVSAGSYDRNGDGKISDGSNGGQSGISEFARVGDLLFETTRAGDIRLGLATNSADQSTVGPSIGKVVAIANDDFIPALAQANDLTGKDVDLANITVVGLTDTTRGSVGGTIGDMSITVGAGDVLLFGNFVSLGATSITASSFIDVSVNPAGDSQVIASGDIRLGTSTGSSVVVNSAPNLTGNGSLNIAGTYKNTSLSVTEQGTITGVVLVAGESGSEWSLTSEKGIIDVGFIAGFDADRRDASGKAPVDPGYNPATTSISTSEAGAIGSISARSTLNANVSIAIGGRAETSSIGSVGVSTGDVVTVRDGEVDTLASGNAVIRGVGYYGSIGSVTTQVKTGVATLGGGFGALGNVSLRTGAYVDSDTTSATGEEPAVIKAGDIELNSVYIRGAHGTIDLVTVDSSALAAGKSALAGTVLNTGDISGSLVFSGGLATGVTTGVVGKTDRGTVFLGIASGENENLNALYDPEETGTVGDVTITSTDGNITLGIENRNRGSSFGDVSVSTGDTWQVVAGGADVARSVGIIVFEALKWGQSAALGSVGDVDIHSRTGTVHFGAVTGSYFNDVGKISVTTGSWTDSDSTSATGEAPVTLAGGNISFKTDFYGRHNTVTLKAADTDVTGVHTAMNPGSITGHMNMYGSPVAGADSLVLTTQQGSVFFDLNALTRPLVADKLDTDSYKDDPNTNSDDQVGRIGNVVANSKSGDIRVDLNTVSVPKVSSSDAVRYTSIGNISAMTGSSYQVVAGAANDVLRAPGNITITASKHSSGILGNISAQTAVGDIRFGANSVFNHQVGDITLRAGSYSDGSVLDAGDVYFQGTFASTNNNSGNYETTIGVVTLSAAGAVSNAGVGVAGNVYVNTDFRSRWSDTDADGKIDLGEQALFRGGAFAVSVTDGQISYEVNSAADAFGFGAQLPATLLRSTGTSTFAGTGNITIDNTGFEAGFSRIGSFTTETVDGDVSFYAKWSSLAVDTFQLNAGKGKVTFDGLLQIDTPRATDFDAAQLRMKNFILNAGEGEVVVGTQGKVGGAFSPHLEYSLPSGAVDSRSLVLENVTLKAGGGTAAGKVSVLGLIGGVEITEISQLLFEVPTYTGRIELNSTALSAPNVLAHDLGTIRFNGNATLSGGTVILASDILTGRTNLNGLDYLANTPAAAPNKGSSLDVINEIIFNGSVTGNSVASLLTGNRAEIEASKIGSILIQAKIDPSMGGTYTASNLDILASNSRGGFAQGEALIMDGYSTLDAAHSINAFTIGNVTITHDLIAPVGGTTVFAGSNAFSAFGGMGDITITSVPSGAFQAPLLTPMGAAWFAVGDGNGLGNLDGRVDGYGNNSFVDYHDVNTTAGVPGDEVSIGNVLINVGSSYVPPANQLPDFGNIGGSASLPNDGLAILAAAIAPTAADNAARRIAASTDLYGYIASVEMRSANLRPNADATDFAVVENTLFGGNAANGDGNSGAFIAVAGNNSTAGIGDVINDQSPAVVPLLPGQGRIIGLAGDLDEYDQGDIVVYVL